MYIVLSYLLCNYTRALSRLARAPRPAGLARGGRWNRGQTPAHARPLAPPCPTDLARSRAGRTARPRGGRLTPWTRHGAGSTPRSGPHGEHTGGRWWRWMVDGGWWMVVSMGQKGPGKAQAHLGLRTQGLCLPTSLQCDGGPHHHAPVLAGCRPVFACFCL
jgi:hypothetical protein